MMSTPKTGRFASLSKLCTIEFLVSGEATKVVDQSCPKILQTVKTFAFGNHHLSTTYNSEYNKQIDGASIWFRLVMANAPL